MIRELERVGNWVTQRLGCNRLLAWDVTINVGRGRANATGAVVSISSAGVIITAASTGLVPIDCGG